MVQKDFIGRSSCTVRVREKLKRQLGHAPCIPMLPSLQVAIGSAVFFSASGNGSGRSWNNRGSNGNYWSSTQNPSNSNNAYNLNFNSDNANWNNNNRNNGHTVRPVSSTYHISIILEVHPFLSFCAAGMPHLLYSYVRFKKSA
jgi:hypothetical protein